MIENLKLNKKHNRFNSLFINFEEVEIIFFKLETFCIKIRKKIAYESSVKFN